MGRVMRLQGWVGYGYNLAAGFFSAASGRQVSLNIRTQKYVRLFSTSGAGIIIMAEEAKKLAAYAAVDNHVQVSNDDKMT